jgi:hypothetical protein
LTREYCGVLGNFNGRISDTPKCAKTMAQPLAGLFRARTFAAVTPRGGADRNNPCQDHGTSATNGGPEKRENASPLFEIEQGAAFMVSQHRFDRCFTSGTLAHLLFYKTSIGAIETMRRNRAFCQQTLNRFRLRRILVSLL